MKELPGDETRARWAELLASQSLMTHERSRQLLAVLQLPREFLEEEDDMLRPIEEHLGGDSQTDFAEVCSAGIAFLQRWNRCVEKRMEKLGEDALTLQVEQDSLRRSLSRTRSEAERARIAARTAIQGTVREFGDLLRQQADSLCDLLSEELFQTLEIQAVERRRAVEFRVDEGWWAAFTARVEARCKSWTEKLSTEVEQALTATMEKAAKPLVSLAKGRPLPTSDEVKVISSSAAIQALRGYKLPIKRVDLPSRMTGIASQVRADVGTAGLLWALLVATAAVPGGGAWLTGSFWSKGLIGLIPVSLGWAIVASREQRQQFVRTALVGHRQQLQSQIRTELLRTIERHRRGLERWIHASSEQRLDALDQFWKAELDSHFSATDAEADAENAEQRRKQFSISERLVGLRWWRYSVGEGLLKELRVALRFHQLRGLPAPQLDQRVAQRAGRASGV